MLVVEVVLPVVISVMGRKGTPPPHLQFMAQSVPPPQIVIMQGKGTRQLSGAQT